MANNRSNSILILLLGLFTFTQSSLSASLKFERFSNIEGFNQNTIISIVEDKYGFLWFGTPNGLIKYDGYNFFNFTNDPTDQNSISNNNIVCLFADEEGYLWIGTREGVDVYLPSQEKFIRAPLGKNMVISQIKADPNGKIWILGNNTFFNCELEKSEEQYTFIISDDLLKEIPNLPSINNFCYVDEKKVLFSCLEGLFLLDLNYSGFDYKSEVNPIQCVQTFENSEVKALTKIDNIFWIGTSNGLFKAILDGERMRIIQNFELTSWDNRKISNLDVLSIFQDYDANVWIGSAKEGVFKYSSKKDSFENYGYDPRNNLGISSPRINCFFQDRFNVIWIGTAQGGINKLDVEQKQFINYSNNPYDEESISGNLINGILEDSQGKLWVSNYDESICRSIFPVDDNNIAKLRFERLSKSIPLEEGDVFTTIYEDKKGYIWLGADNSLFVFNPADSKFRQIELINMGIKLPFSNCRVISQIDQEHILLGGETIVILHNPWRYLHNNKNVSLKVKSFYNELERVQTFLKDRNGNLWIGTINGLFKFSYRNDELNILKSYSTQEVNRIKLSNNDIFSLHEDISGNIWIGTFGGGLNKLVLNEQGEIVNIEYYRKNGLLPDDAVYGILQEDGEHLWISTDMGLCRLDILNNRIDLFDVRDGLPNNNFRQSAFFKGKSGYFYFGGLNGLTIFKPETIRLNNILPVSLITEISINNNRIKIGENVFGKILLEKSVVETDRVVISHRAKILTFNLTAQHSVAPTKNKLAYILEGFSSEWIETETGKTSITYTNLPPGDYLLKVKSANGDGLWNDESANLNIKVLPAWYQTWWSFTIFLFVIIAIVIGVFLYFFNHEKLKQSLKYEQIDKKRIDNINQGKLQFFTNISHEFRTPLTLIAGPLERLVVKNKDKEDSKYLSIIQNNTIRLLNLVDQLVTFRQAEQGHLKINLSADSLGSFIYPAAEAFEDYAIHKNINFFYKVNSPNEEVVLDVEKTERIIFNLLSNSFRHTPAHGNISIESEVIFTASEKMVSIKVIDTGKGIPVEKQGKIFERFYQVEDRKENIGGTGIGLAFCKSLIDMMEGSISVESEPNTRTCFSVLIPSKTNNINNENVGIHGQSFIKSWIPKPVNFIDESSDFNKNKNNFLNSLLIVEDEADVRNFLMNTLHDKYSILLAENGIDGLNKIKQYEPDLVISDVMMPGMDGFELCEKIKSNPTTCHIPIILLTALGDKENTIKGLGYRADDYISKPFSIQHLEIRIEKLIENNRRLKEYFSKNTGIPDKSIDISGRDREFLSRTIEAIEKNLSNSGFGVEELAYEIRLSPSQFYRRLKQLTGQIPNVYIRNYRLQKAAKLLKSNKGLNMAEIMYQIGIESHSYFSTSFKKLYGVSPTEFNKNNSPGSS